MKPLWELENSKDLIDRQNFVKRLKDMIAIKTSDVKNLEKQLEDYKKTAFPDEELQEHYRDREQEYKNQIANEYRFISFLRNKLENYDIYSQKSLYYCIRCKEEDCVCGEL